MLRFGISGCGLFMEKAVIPMLVKSQTAQIIAAFDTNTEKLTQVCKKFNIKSQCKSFEQLVEHQDVDVVYIASPNFLHTSQTIAAAKAGKHVFCQKPTGMNSDECRAAITACKENGVQYGVGFCNRFHGAIEKTRETINSGRLGDISYFHMSFNLFGFTKEAVGWRAIPKLSGGGPLMDIAPHMIDLARFLLDDEAEFVMGYTLPKKTDTEIEMDALAILQMKKNIWVTIDTSFNRRESIGYTVAGSKGAIRCFGGFGWLTGGKEQSLLTLEIQGKEPEVIEHSGHEHIAKEIFEFCNAVENNQPLPVSGVDGLKAQQIIDAIYKSAKTGKRIKL